jgi:lysophospholipase L1-like esterase
MNLPAPFLNLLRIGRLIAGNLLVFLLLFAAAEFAIRIHRDGFAVTFDAMMHRNAPTPGTRWAIDDEELGYRLNPAMDGINERSVVHGKIAVPKPPGLYRVLYLGDSVAAASRAKPRENFVSFTRDFLETQGDYEVINAAVPGYTSYQEVLFYKRYLADTNSDLVVWVYCLNDNHRFLHRLDQKRGMLLTEEVKASLQVHSHWWDYIVRRSYFLTSIRVRLRSLKKQSESARHAFEWEDSIVFNNAWKDETWPSYENDLRTLKQLVESHGGKLAIIIVPYEPQILHRNDKEHAEYVLKPQHKLIELCGKYQVPCLDLYQAFCVEYSQKRALYLDKVHLNPAGHRIVADQIDQFLMAEGLVPRR